MLLQSPEINTLNMVSEININSMVAKDIKLPMNIAHGQELICGNRRMMRGLKYLVMSRPFSGHLCPSLCSEHDCPAYFCFC